MGIKVVVFDLGNVVESHLYDQFYGRMARRYHVSVKEFKRVFLKHLRRTDKAALPEARLADEIGRDLQRDIDEKILFKEHEAQCVPNAAVVKVVDRLRGKYPLVLFSNLNRMHAGWSEKKLHLKKRFDIILFSYQYKTRKPEIKFYRVLLKKVKVRPEECLFIDDNNRNLKPARKLGIKTIQYKNGMNLQKKIENALAGI